MIMRNFDLAALYDMNGQPQESGLENIGICLSACEWNSIKRFIVIEIQSNSVD